MNIPFDIYADTESLLGKIQKCDNNSEKSFTSKVNKHTLRWFSVVTMCSFGTKKVNMIFKEVKTNKFYRNLRKHTMEITDYKKMEMIPIKDDENESYCNQTYFVTYSKGNLRMMMMTKIIKKFKIRVSAHNICNLRFETLNEIHAILSNG